MKTTTEWIYTSRRWTLRANPRITVRGQFGGIFRIFLDKTPYAKTFEGTLIGKEAAFALAIELSGRWARK